LALNNSAPSAAASTPKGLVAPANSAGTAAGVSTDSLVDSPQAINTNAPKLTKIYKILLNVILQS
jgi:hypothetical protein